MPEDIQQTILDAASHTLQDIGACWDAKMWVIKELKKGHSLDHLWCTCNNMMWRSWLMAKHGIADVDESNPHVQAFDKQVIQAYQESYGYSPGYVQQYIHDLETISYASLPNPRFHALRNLASYISPPSLGRRLMAQHLTLVLNDTGRFVKLIYRPNEGKHKICARCYKPTQAKGILCPGCRRRFASPGAGGQKLEAATAEAVTTEAVTTRLEAVATGSEVEGPETRCGGV